MAYVTNRRGVIRTGFRPTYSNPFKAAMMETGPTPKAALAGLGNIIPDQSIVTWIGQVSGTASLSVQDVISAASAALLADGLPVINTAGLPFALFDINIQFSSSAQVTLTLQVNNGMGYGQPSDIAAIVNHEIFVASGVMPAGAVTNVQAPGAGGTAPNPAGAPTTMSAWLQQNAMWIGIGVLGVVLLPDLLDRFS